MSDPTASPNKKRKALSNDSFDVSTSKEELLQGLSETKKELLKVKAKLEVTQAELATALEASKNKNNTTANQNNVTFMVSNQEVDDEPLTDDENSTDAWIVKFKELRTFCIVEKHFNVQANQDKKLANWVRWQREQYRKKNLSEERIAKLEAIGFPWGKKYSSPPTWEKNYDDLKKYQAAMRHCNVPINAASPSALAKWVSAQRSEYRRFHKGADSFMTLEKIGKLNDIGFDWKGPRLS